MAIFVITAGLYCSLHFIWESIVAPSMRLTIRFELFALRDKVRGLRISKGIKTDGAFRSVEDGINSAIQILYVVDLPMLKHCYNAIRRDEKLQEVIKKRMALVDESGCEELNEIMTNVQKIVERTAVINSGGWFLYVIPISFLAIFCKRIFLPISTLIYAPKPEVARLVPQYDSANCPA